MNDVVVVGCGGIGLPFAVALASRGVSVLGVDSNDDLVRRLNFGDLTLRDAGLAPAFSSALKLKTLKFAQAAGPEDRNRAWVIAVPTPVGVDLNLDASALQAAFTQLLSCARPGDLVMIRSTVPVGCTRSLAQQSQGHGLLFASCPDRSVGGAAFAEQFSAPHIVGGLDEEASRAAAGILARIGETVIVSSPEAAETLKLFANVWRDARFAVANQFAMFCTAAGLDFAEIRAAGAKNFPRFDVPRAGPVGGPCLVKDVYLLAQSAAAAGAPAPFLLGARQVNAGVVDHVVAMILDEIRSSGREPSVAILGLAFKGVPEILDRRGSIGVAILQRLKDSLPDIAVRTWDPAEDAGGDDGFGAADSATIVVLANDHPALGVPDRLAGCAPGALVYDLCGVLTAASRADLRIRRFGAERAS